jgi:hypothetical protein
LTDFYYLDNNRGSFLNDEIHSLIRKGFYTHSRSISNQVAKVIRKYPDASMAEPGLNWFTYLPRNAYLIAGVSV